jgi:uncharacterized OB-fold protein
MLGRNKMICQECGKELTNENDCYGHDCEVETFIVQKINTDAMKFIEYLETEYNITIAELEGYYTEAKRLKLIR